jgi:hypothetical protein
VARKLNDIKSDVDEKRFLFHQFFYKNIDADIEIFISHLEKLTKVFIFSGIIRDFFVFKNQKPFRDIDLIIEEDLVLEEIFPALDFKKNSFGGYKIKFKTVDIDLWVIKKTWALNQGQLKFKFDYLNALPKTTFFNFSSILFSLETKEFITGKDFLRFLRDKKIELVLKENPYPELCIVNSFYYSDKLQLDMGDKLKSYLKSNYTSKMNVESIQLKHFGKILYSDEYIRNKIEEMFTN